MTLATMFLKLTELHRLADLPDNWDGEGAPVPNAKAIQAAHGHIVAMAEAGLVPNDVGPDVLGGVALTWDTSPLRDGWSMWVACMNSGETTFVISDAERVRSHGMVDMGRTREAA